MSKTTTRTTEGPDFLARSLATTGVLLLAVMAIGPVWFRFYDCLAIFSAGVWSLINFIFLAALIRAAVRPDGVDRLRVAGLALVKFPLLYGAGYCLVTLPFFRIVPLLFGLSSILIVMVLKAVGRVLMGLDDVPQTSPEGAAR